MIKHFIIAFEKEKKHFSIINYKGNPRQKEDGKPEIRRERAQAMARLRLLATDFMVSLMWVWSGALIKMVVFQVLGFPAQQPNGEILKGALFIANMFFFVWLGKATGGGSYNPLTVLATSISGNFTGFLFASCARIPTQVHFFFFSLLLITEFDRSGFLVVFDAFDFE